MNILHDHHIHTLYSGHSHPTMLVGRIIAQAEKAGLKRIVILEHVPEVNRDREKVLAGTFDPTRRPQIDAIVEEVREWRSKSSARIFVGAEIDADPRALDGSLLVQRLDGIDVVLASTHYLPGDRGTWFDIPAMMPDEFLADVYEKWVIWMMKIAANPAVDVLSHPGAEMAAIGAIKSFSGKVLEDFDKIIQVCAKYNTAFELNEMLVDKAKADVAEGYENVIQLCIDHGAKVSIGSDSHYPERIGRYDWVKKIAEKVNLKPEHYFHPRGK